MSILTIHTDGSADFGKDPNPTKGGISYAYSSYYMMKGGKFFEERCFALGKGTCNEAEYAAIILALYNAKELGEKNVEVYTDSFIVCHIINRRHVIKNSTIRGANIWTPKIHKFIDENFDYFTIEWFKRNNNLADKVIDRHKRTSQITGIVDMRNL